MEMMNNIAGLGVAIPKTGFGLNLATASYIGFRLDKNNYDLLLGLKDCFSLGTKSGTLIGSWIKTDWFMVDIKRHGWVADINRLVGSKVEIEVVGTVVAFGTVDLKLTAIDKYGNTKELMSKVDIKASGGQLSNTKIRGTVGMVAKR